jgi:hypothetical protein
MADASVLRCFRRHQAEALRAPVLGRCPVAPAASVE